MWRCLRGPAFSNFRTVPACDRRTHDDSIYRASHRILCVQTSAENVNLMVVTWPVTSYLCKAIRNVNIWNRLLTYDMLHVC